MAFLTISLHTVVREKYYPNTFYYIFIWNSNDLNRMIVLFWLSVYHWIRECIVCPPIRFKKDVVLNVKKNQNY